MRRAIAAQASKGLATIDTQSFKLSFVAPFSRNI
jgi:hypothetical protein